MFRILPLLFSMALIASARADELIDPTRPSGFAAPSSAARAETSSPLRLTLIRLGTQPLAVVNGRSLRTGDVIDGKRLTAIQPGRVLLAGNDGPLVLTLLPSRSTTNTPSPSIKRRPTL